MAVFQLLVLFLALLAIHSILSIKSKILSLFTAFCLALIFVIQLSSVVLTGEIANYRFYENFNIKDVLSVADFFGKEGVLLAIALVSITFLIHFLSKTIKKQLARLIIPICALIGSLIILSFQGGILYNAYSTIQLKLAKDASLDQALSNLKINKDDYVYKNEITATKGKNIIVLSLESLEKAYLSEKLKELTPNLRSLAKENTFLTMQQCPAGAWTSASMYIAMTGIPAFFKTHGNRVFQSSHENKLTTLPDVLKKAGYDLQYFIGKKEFSGIDDMLKTHGFTVKSELDFTTKYKKVSWGIQDMDLFKEFKKALLLKRDTNQPFAFFLSTIGTHFPNGVPDSRVDSLMPPQKSRLELMASATDSYVGDLIDFLKKEKMMENTVFFIYPDHLLMGNSSRVIEDFDARSLYLLTNAKASEIGVDSNEKIYQIDVPKLILKGAGIENNVKFLTDFIPTEDKNVFINKNAKSITQLNTAALKTLNLNKGFTVSKNEEDNSFVIKNEDNIVVLQKKIPPTGVGKRFRILLDENFRPFNNSFIPYSYNAKDVPTKSYLDIFNTNQDLYVSLNGSNKLGISKKSSDVITFSIEDIKLIEEINSIDQSVITINSNSWLAKTASGFRYKGKNEVISRGLTVIALNAQLKLDYRNFDTYGSVTAAQNFVKTIDSLETDKTPYLILAHDSAANSLKTVAEKLEQLGFKKLSKIKDRQAYVMYNLDGDKVEQIDGKSINLQLVIPPKIKNTKLYFSEPKTTFKPNVNRYIAHAGGEIDGLKYTNSLDAINFNYKQGFRMFELDISKTSDGHFVASHDWKHWKKETNYKGDVPVTLNEFKKHKIRGKYVSLDIDAINKWFSEHKDAILVTDKINTPEEFASNFVDKSRLVMELFSLDASNEALKIGISPLLSEQAISEIKGDRITYLKDHNIKYIGLSRKAIKPRKDFLKKCRANDIKVYVYHVNFEKGKDEQYVNQNEIGIVYGMYADKWLSEFNPR